MVRKIILLGGGNALAQFLSYLTIPIGFFLYTPESVGQYGVFFATVSIVCSIVLMRQDRVLLKLNGRYLEKYSFFLFNLLLIFTVLISCFLLFFFELSDVILLSFCILMFSVSFVQQNMYIVKDKLIKVNAIKASQSFVLIATQLIFSYLINDKAYALKLSLLCSYVSSVFMGLNKQIFSYRNNGFRRCYRIFTSNWRVLLYTWPSTNLNNLSANLPIVFIENYIGSVYAGYYSLASRAIQVPASLLIQSCSQIYQSTIKSKRDLYIKFKFGLKFSFALSFIYIISIYIVCFFIIEKQWLLDEWIKSIYLIIFFLPWISQLIVYSPLQAFLVASKNNELELKFNLILMISRLLILYLMLEGGFDFFTICLAYSAFSAIAWFIYGEVIKNNIFKSRLHTNLNILWMFIVFFFISYSEFFYGL